MALKDVGKDEIRQCSNIVKSLHNILINTDANVQTFVLRSLGFLAIRNDEFKVCFEISSLFSFFLALFSILSVWIFVLRTLGLVIRNDSSRFGFVFSLFWRCAGSFCCNCHSQSTLFSSAFGAA